MMIQKIMTALRSAINNLLKNYTEPLFPIVNENDALEKEAFRKMQEEVNNVMHNEVEIFNKIKEEIIANENEESTIIKEKTKEELITEKKIKLNKMNMKMIQINRIT
jgi:hypothetical protein